MNVGFSRRSTVSKKKTIKTHQYHVIQDENHECEKRCSASSFWSLLAAIHLDREGNLHSYKLSLFTRYKGKSWLGQQKTPLCLWMLSRVRAEGHPQRCALAWQSARGAICCLLLVPHGSSALRRREDKDNTHWFKAYRFKYPATWASNAKYILIPAGFVQYKQQCSP